MAPALAVVDEQAIQKQTGDIEARAEALVINSPEDYQGAGALARICVAARKKIVETFKPMKESTHLAHQETCALEKKFLQKAEGPEKMVKGKMGDWALEQERLRQEQLARERKAREDAARKEEQLRREAQEKADQETARLKKEEEDRRLARAQELQESGQAKEADALLEAPSNVQKVEADPVPSQVPMKMEEPEVKKASADGTSVRMRWSAEVYDFKALVKAVADGKAPIACLGVDQPAMNRMAVTLKDDMDIPGVRAISKPDIAVR